MQQVPEEVAAALKGGNCVLWTGAGFGAALGRPSWPAILQAVAERLPEGQARGEVLELLEQGRTRTVLAYLSRHLGDDPIHEELLSNDNSPLPQEILAFADLPFRATFCTTYADVIARAHKERGRTLDVISHRDVHGLTLRDDREPFILRTPPQGRQMRADDVLFALVEEVVRTRNLVFAGFDVDDPDLAQILDLLGRVGRGRTHLALFPFVSLPECEALYETYRIRVVRTDAEAGLADAARRLKEAAETATATASTHDADFANLDLLRTVRWLPVRADEALDAALSVALDEVAALVDRIPGPFAGTDPGTVLRTGCVFYAHDRNDEARRAFQHVIQRGSGKEYAHVARLNLALCACRDGDFLAAVDGLARVGEADRSMAVVPPRFEIQEVLGQDGARLVLGCRDRETGESLDVEVGVLSRPAPPHKARAFYDEVHRVAEVAHPAIKPVRGGFADGRLFGVLTAPRPGFALSDLLAEGGPVPLSQTVEWLAPILDALAALHAEGLVHRNVTPRQIVVTEDGPLLRGFGPPPVVDHVRPSVRRATAGYAAPELLAGEPATPACDVYAAAAVIVHCLAGRPVPRGCADLVRLLRDPPPRLSSVLYDALSDDATLRPSAAALRALLLELAGTVGEDAHRVLAPPAARDPEPVAPGLLPAATSGPIEVALPDDPEDLEAWAVVLERVPKHAEALAAVAAIEQAARETGRWDRVAAVLGVRARTAQVQADRVRYLQDLAEVLETRLGAPSDAFSTLQALLEQVPPARQAALVDDLARLAEVTGRYDDLAASMEAVAVRLARPEERAAMYLRLGDLLLEKLGSADRALAAYTRAAEAEPSLPQAQRGRVEAARALGRHTDLAAGLLAYADLVQGVRRAEALVEAARHLAEDLDDPEGALAALSAAFEADAGVLGEAGLARLLSLAEVHGAWDLWVDAAEAAAERAEAEDAAHLLRRAAEVAEERLDDPARAADLLGRAGVLDPSDLAAARKRVALLAARVEDDPSLRPHLVDARVDLADRLGPGRERAEHLAAAARLLDAEGGQAERAAALRRDVLDLLPPQDPVHQEARRDLLAQSKAAGDEEGWVELLRREAADPRADTEARIEDWRTLLHHAEAHEDDGLRVEALAALVELAPDRTEYVDALLAHWIDTGAYDRAGPLVRRRVDMESDPRKKADLLVRGARLRLEIGKVQGAIEALEEAVALDPKRADAHGMLRGLYDQTGQPRKAAEAAVAEAEATVQRSERARLRREAARRLAETGAEPGRSRALLTAAHADDPDDPETAEALLSLLSESEDPEAVARVAGALVAALTARGEDGPRLRKALSAAGRAALALSDEAAARDFLQRARRLGSHEPEVMRLLGDLEHRAGNLEEALAAYQSALLSAGEAMPPPEQAVLYRSMARIQKALEDPAKARALCERALELAGDDDDAYALALELAQTPAETLRVHKQRAAALQEKLASAAGEEAVRLREQLTDLLERVAKLQAEELGLADEAVRTLEETLRVAPDALGPLHTMLEILTSRARWEDAVKVLDRLAQRQDDPKLRAKYRYAQAALLRDEVGDRARAAEAFWAVVEDDPGNEKAYGALRGLYEAEDDPRGLARTLRAELRQRLADLSAEERVARLEALGEVYEHRLGDPVTAMAAYEQAAALRGADDRATELRGHIVELALELGGEHVEQAIAQIHALIDQDPTAFELYHRLVALYAETGAHGRAISVCRTLRFLRQATDHEADLASRGEGKLPQARATLDAKALRRLLDPPEKDAHLSALSAVIWPMAAIREGRTHAHLGLRRDARVPVTRTSPDAPARFLAYACQVFEVPVPDLFVQEAAPGGLSCGALLEVGDGVVRAVYPTVVAGADALRPAPDPAHAFRAGRAAALLRPDALLAAVAGDHHAVRAAVVAAMRTVVPDLAVPEEIRASVTGFAEVVEAYLPAGRKDAFERAARALVDAGRVDVKAYVRGVSLAASRAGLLLCDSLDTAGRIVTQETQDGLIPPKERIRDLVRYSVSRPFLEARETLFGT